MHISYGTTRIVIAVPQCGIAIKFARIRAITALRELPNHMRHYKIFQKIPLQYRNAITPMGYLLRGIIENWGEWCFYRVTKNPLLQPTYFSFLGLLNIQKHGTPLEEIGVSVAHVLLAISECDRRVYDDKHHFSHSGNYTQDESGKLRILDYGLKVTQEVIFAYGARLHNKFVFPDETT